jgi:putative ATP-dependent endonuclease of OLD family
MLCEKAILVEGDSDELVVQKAYAIKYGKLPIEDGIDVISVGTSFLRFLEVAVKLDKPVTVVTDNDGNVAGVQSKYAEYLGAKAKPTIRICYEPTADPRESLGGERFNFNTLEPLMLNANGRSRMNEILGTSFDDEDGLLRHMHANKTDCALKIFGSSGKIDFPGYISKAIN